MGCCVEITNGASNGGGAAAAWSAVLAVGNVSGGTDAVISTTDELRGVDESGSGTGAAGPLNMQAGSHSGTTAGDDGGPLEVAGGDAGLGGPSFSVGGDATFRGGDLQSTGNNRGGNLIVRSGEGNLASTADFGAGTVHTGSNPGGLTTIHGGDQDATGVGGDMYVRGGAAISGSGNDAGGDTAVAGGLARNIAVGGDLFLRSGLPVTSQSSGDIRMTTNLTNSLGPSPAGGNAFSSSGDIDIDTVGIGATAPNSGTINLETGSIGAGATGGTGPGDITMTAGNLANTGQSFLGAGSIALTAGSNAGATSAPGGDVTVTCGAQTGTGAQANSPGGSFSVLCGASAHNNALSGGGDLVLTAGNSSSVNGPGGDADITAGDITNAAAVGPAGEVTLTAGSVTNAGSGADAGDINITPGTAAGAGRDGVAIVSTQLLLDSATDPTFADTTAASLQIGDGVIANVGMTLRAATGGLISFVGAEAADTVEQRIQMRLSEDVMRFRVGDNEMFEIENSAGPIQHVSPAVAQTGLVDLGLPIQQWRNLDALSQNVGFLDTGAGPVLDDTNWFITLSAGNVTLPPASDGTRYYLMRNEAAGSARTVTPDGADTIDGGASATIPALSSAYIVSDGVSDWRFQAFS